MMENNQIKSFLPSANSFFFFHESSDSKMIRSNKFLRAMGPFTNDVTLRRGVGGFELPDLRDAEEGKLRDTRGGVKISGNMRDVICEWPLYVISLCTRMAYFLNSEPWFLDGCLN